MSYKVVFADSFKRCIKQLEKRYPNVKNDIQIGIRELLINPQLGNVIPGGSGCRKYRVVNSDNQRGKSGGYRLIYFQQTESQLALLMLFLYSKSDQSDITRKELRRLVNEIKQSLE